MSTALWALGRGTGVVSLVLITVSVVLGILTRSGRPAFGLPRFAVTLVHRNASLLGSVFVVIHVVSLFFDSYAQLDLVDLFLPFLGAANPLWLGFGTVGLDLLFAIVITALLRARVGRRVFRAVHWFSYAMWPIALVHALGMGSDASSAWFLLLTGLCIALVGGALVWRVNERFVEYRSRRVHEFPADPTPALAPTPTPTTDTTRTLEVTR
ncbi:ferric reductase-like transmembrane domain-containing protein [Galbitalea soli]|uniref:Iron reductase n=1 Tax=Galbitalea soli TaxID=1268042 RepID=A0A7C9PL36_9MICO|nr:ferric reductase-like transmembrane domain-containing protein [Galbitalea soli]NEM89787.1 iron reductase [Galbitalea soli]NYJ30490.1 putative ferric reductase [Galbitalea soli]